MSLNLHARSLGPRVAAIAERRRLALRGAFSALLFVAAASASAASLTAYDGALENGFADYYSWAATYSFTSTTTVRNAETHSISFKPDNWGGVRLLANNGN